MSIPRSVLDVIQNHVTLEVEGIDRMYLNVYQPKAADGKRSGVLFPFPAQAARCFVVVDGRHDQRFLAAGRCVH